MFEIFAAANLDTLDRIVALAGLVISTLSLIVSTCTLIVMYKELRRLNADRADLLNGAKRTHRVAVAIGDDHDVPSPVLDDEIAPLEPVVEGDTN